MMKPAIAAMMIGFFAFAAYTPAIAQTATTAISIEQATKIARDRGIVQIREIELDDGKWEIEGRDDKGVKREIDIDARTGQIVKDEID